MSLVIVGGGIIGLSIAYYHALARPDRQIIIIDSESELLKSASGFSGGYLVRDWFAPSVLPLAELSFKLHKDLADTNGGRQRWGYCESTAYSMVSCVDQAEGSESTGPKKIVRGEDWLLYGTSRAEAAKAYVSSTAVIDTLDSDDVRSKDGVSSNCLPEWVKVPIGANFEKISSESGCAQVEPRELCQWLEGQCRMLGVEFFLNTQPIGLVQKDRERFSAIRVEAYNAGCHPRRYDIICNDVVISAGCWTPRVFKTLLHQKMSPGINPLPGYSCVVRSQQFSRSKSEALNGKKNVEMVHATFCPPTSKWSYSPECMARHSKDGPEIYVAGLNDEMIILPERAGLATSLMERSKLDDLRKTAEDLVRGSCNEEDAKEELELVREGLCFRPVSESGLPIISKVAGVEFQRNGHLYVASGHGPWGISLSLGTGYVVSELLEGNKHRALTKELELATHSEILRARL